MKRTRLFAGLIVAAATLAVAWQAPPPSAGLPPGPALETAPAPLPPAAVPAPAAAPKEATVDELIAELAELKAKEAKLVAQLRAKLKKQRGELEKLKKAGVNVEEEQLPSPLNVDTPKDAPPFIPDKAKG